MIQPKIKYIDGSRLRNSIIAAANRVVQMQESLNNINVFPVADADTGTNMAITMRCIAEGAEKCRDTSFAGMSGAIADSALIGARGNSGAILAQFFQGFAEATRGKMRLSTQAFAKAVADASERAREALSNPKDGTILTVMKDWAAHLTEHATRKHDFVDLLRESLLRARESLAETPEKLKVLRKAGVVDAGAQGFVHILEGLNDFIESGKIVALKTSFHVVEKFRHFHFHKANEKITHRFCTECLIEGRDLNRQNILQLLAPFGDSLIVVGSGRKVRIHIHTNKPQLVFDNAATLGKLAQTKTEDMRKQHLDALSQAPTQAIALVTDSTCDLPAELLEKYHVNVIPVLLIIGGQSHLDRLEIKTQDFYRILKNSTERLATSQPPPAHFSQVYERLAGQYESAIALHISGQLSGTINGARMGTKGFEERLAVDIIDSKTTSAALGLLVAEAGRLVDSGLKREEIVRRLGVAIENVRLFVSVPTLKYIMRSGRLHKAKGILGTLLNLKPVLTLDSQGRVVEAAKVIGRTRVYQRTLELADQFAMSVRNPRFSIVHVMNLPMAEWYREELKKRFKVDEIMITEASPALGVHTGIGSVAIAVLGDPMTSQVLQ